MKTGAERKKYSFPRVLELVRSLTRREKIKLSKELEKDIINARLTALLRAFRTEELDRKTIEKEVEAVRSHSYAASRTR